MFADLALVKEVFRYQDQIRGIWVILIFKAGSPENLRVIEPQFKKLHCLNPFPPGAESEIRRRDW